MNHEQFMSRMRERVSNAGAFDVFCWLIVISLGLGMCRADAGCSERKGTTELVVQ